MARRANPGKALPAHMAKGASHLPIRAATRSKRHQVGELVASHLLVAGENMLSVAPPRRADGLGEAFVVPRGSQAPAETDRAVGGLLGPAARGGWQPHPASKAFGQSLASPGQLPVFCPPTSSLPESQK